MLLSFHGKKETKDYYVARVQAHYDADEVIQGTYWQNGKGCAVGCTIHNDDHGEYESILGIPRIIARLEDRIFEGMRNEDAKLFPLSFIKAIPVGVDLIPVWKKFLIWLLIDPKTGVIKHAKTDETEKSISDVAELIQRSLIEKISSEQFEEIRNAAAAAYAAAAADAAAAYAAAYAAAAYAAADYAAAYAAAAYAAAADAAAAYAAAADAAAADADAADADAADAAYADAAYAAADAAADADDDAAKKDRYKQMGDKLVQLLSEAK